MLKIGLKSYVLELGLEGCDNLQNVDDFVVDFMFLCCFEYYVAYRTCKHCRNSFWVIRGSKLSFWMKKGLRVREFLNCQMKLRLSELPVA